VLLNQTTNWTRGINNFTLAACSGAQYYNIAEAGNSSQIAKSGNPRFITLQIGGNNIGFYDVVVSCIYQPIKDHDYGPEYADDSKRVGECAKSIDRARARIRDARGWITGTMLDVMQQPNTKPDPKFDIFLLGYAHFFNDAQDSPCNKWSFGAIPWWVRGSHQPKLSHPLRRDLNDLVEQLNNQYRAAVRDITNGNRAPKGSRAHFVDISPGFNGHRFCEPEHQWFFQQYYGTWVWIWNLSPDTPDNMRQDYPEKQSASSGAFVATIEQSHLIAFSDKEPGVISRCFHPKIDGHKAIKDLVLTAIKDAKIAGTIWG
jgi:hypothetical protein